MNKNILNYNNQLSYKGKKMNQIRDTINQLNQNKKMILKCSKFNLKKSITSLKKVSILKLKNFMMINSKFKNNWKFYNKN